MVSTYIVAGARFLLPLVFPDDKPAEQLLLVCHGIDLVYVLNKPITASQPQTMRLSGGAAAALGARSVPACMLEWVGKGRGKRPGKAPRPVIGIGLEHSYVVYNNIN